MKKWKETPKSLIPDVHFRRNSDVIINFFRRHRQKMRRHNVTSANEQPRTKKSHVMEQIVLQPVRMERTWYELEKYNIKHERRRHRRKTATRPILKYLDLRHLNIAYRNC